MRIAVQKSSLEDLDSQPSSSLRQTLAFHAADLMVRKQKCASGAASQNNSPLLLFFFLQHIYLPCTREELEKTNILEDGETTPHRVESCSSTGHKIQA